MFDFGVGYSELFLLALIAIVVVGPKDLPRVLRMFGRTMKKIRSMAGEFQGHVDQAMKEAGLEDVQKDLQAIKPGNILSGTSSSLSTSSTPKPAPVADNDFSRFFDVPPDGRNKA